MTPETGRLVCPQWVPENLWYKRVQRALDGDRMVLNGALVWPCAPGGWDFWLKAHLGEVPRDEWVPVLERLVAKAALLGDY